MNEIDQLLQEIDQIEIKINAKASTLNSYTRDFYERYCNRFSGDDLGWLIYDWMTDLEKDDITDINEEMLEQISMDYSKLKELKKLLIEIDELEIQL
jgi:hypothetical protein